MMNLKQKLMVQETNDVLKTETNDELKIETNDDYVLHHTSNESFQGKQTRISLNFFSNMLL